MDIVKKDRMCYASEHRKAPDAGFPDWGPMRPYLREDEISRLTMS